MLIALAALTGLGGLAALQVLNERGDSSSLTSIDAAAAGPEQAAEAPSTSTTTPSTSSPVTAQTDASAPLDESSKPSPGSPDQADTGLAAPFPGLLPAPDPKPRPPISQLAGAALQLEPVLDISYMTGMRWSVLDEAYFAITQDGLVHRIPQDLSNAEVVLDLTAEVTELLPGSERGMLGIAFDPRDGRMFLHFTDLENHTNLVSFPMQDGRPQVDGRRLVLYQKQPGLGHQGGDLHFDDQGNLLIALGDGGGSRGRDAQDPEVLHGSILRITPDLDAEGYQIPPDNPFVGEPGHRGEIFAMGLRNPWRISIDRSTGDIWLGDVGEDTTEELNRIPAGESGLNFGWSWFEGTRDRGIGGRPSGLELTPPVFEYSRSVGVSIIGGVVYHGTAIPALTGAYVFADMTGPFFALGNDGATRLGISGSGIVTSFVETPEGELLVTTLRNGLFRLLAV
jgi:hypothetical protein